MASMKMEKSDPPSKKLEIIGNTTGYIYDISINCSYNGVRENNNIFELHRASMATIVANVIHKYKKWSVAGEVIMDDLLRQSHSSILDLHRQCCSKWELKINSQGCYYGDEIIEDLPAVYDCLSFVGYLKPQSCKLIQDPRSYSMSLDYHVTFFLSPALQAGISYYLSKGYSIQDTPIVHKNYVDHPHPYLIYQKVYNTSNYNDSFDHQKIWVTALLEAVDAKKSVTSSVKLVGQ